MYQALMRCLILLLALYAPSWSQFCMLSIFLQSLATAEEYNQTFSMDNITGHVSLLKKLDFEKNSYYQFTVVAQVISGNSG